MSNEFKDWYNDMSKTQKANYELCMKYPILIPRNRFTGKEVDDYQYEFTELDGMPKGWRIAFGEQWAKEIQDAINLLPEEDREKARITDIKEKYGCLRTYFSGYTDEMNEVISKYELMSERICIDCGQPATKITTGWISPFCDKCVEKYKFESCEDIDEFYKKWEDEEDV